MTTTPTADTTIEPTPEPDESSPSVWRWLKWVLIGVGALILIGVGLVAWRVLTTDSPPALDENDLSAALVEDSVPADEAPAAEEAVDEEPVEEQPVATEAPAEEPVAVPAEGFDGAWVPTDASEFGYRVDEVLAGVNVTAVGRGNDITGVLTIEGTTATSLDIEIQVASIESDDGRRDGQFRGRIMETDQFPTATFSLTQPIEFGTIPGEGEQITATATGDLTLHGVTREVTFELTAEATADRIGVLGNIPVLFSDYDIDNPSFGAVTTEDNGLLEFVLVFERS
ncbi:MAG: YceI family protein [Ilumatobacteraceae bacterium]